MSRILAVWAGLGVLVAVFWAFYASATFPSSLQANPLLWNLAQITCPPAFVSAHFHFPLRLYWVVLANAAIYAFVGFAIETLRRQVRHA